MKTKTTYNPEANQSQIYRGVIPYDEDGAFKFVGRTEEISQLYERILRNDYTVYYAASGEGKSSLIRAGLLPFIKRRGYFPVYIVFEEEEFKNPDAIPSVIFSRISAELDKSQNGDVSFRLRKASRQFYEGLDNEQRSILEGSDWWRLRNYVFVRNDEELTPLYIFDQFEEVFTKVTYNWTDSFFAWLETISTDYVPRSLSEQIESWDLEEDISPRKPFRALFSFRTEYMGDLDYWCIQKHFLPSLQENRLCLRALTPEGAQQVVDLNKSVLGEYSDRIIKGCSDWESDTMFGKEPAVSALILSVVCQTLSDMPEPERIELLKSLKDSQDATIDTILIRFYKDRLSKAGLDMNKDSALIDRIEKAFVDENGKRRRRCTDEKDLEPLLPWINAFSRKDNGLLKTIGRKVVIGEEFYTMELPHDRLCKAIDASRKERQGRMAERLVRQSEWIQFGIIAAVVGVVCYLWNILLNNLSSVMGILMSNGKNLAQKIIGLGDLFRQGDPGLYSGLIMLLLILALPLTLGFERREKKWLVASTILSFLGSISCCILWIKSSAIRFPSKYLVAFIFIAFFAFLVSFVVCVFRLVKVIRQSNMDSLEERRYSLWPLWGGLFIFAAFLFNECLFRTTFGTSEPKDSFWGVFVLPVFYALWVFGYYRLKAPGQGKRGNQVNLPFYLALLSLVGLSIVSYLLAFLAIRHNYGIGIALFLIALIIIAGSFFMRRIESRSQYYTVSPIRRVFIVLMGTILLLAVFILNLGYNPLVISPKTVQNVSSWRLVNVKKELSETNALWGFSYPVTGEEVLPCIIPSEMIDGTCWKKDTVLWEKDKRFVKYGNVKLNGRFQETPFISGGTVNFDGSFRWNPSARTAQGTILVHPELESYIMKTRLRWGRSKASFTLRDSIDYYAASLFNEMRKESVSYMITNSMNCLDSLPSFHFLDSLQYYALKQEMLGLMEIEPYHFEDHHFVSLFKELCRDFLLCMIKDRVNHNDQAAVFGLMKSYVCAYFTTVDNLIVVSNFSVDESLNEIRTRRSYKIDQKDIREGKAFPWYELLLGLCALDSSWYSRVFESNMQSIIDTKVGDLLLLKEVLDKGMHSFDEKEVADLLERVEMSISEISRQEDIDGSYQRFCSLIDTSLIPFMQGTPDGIYNNAFESICNRLYMVSAFRGYEVSNDSLKQYATKKNAYFNKLDTLLVLSSNNSQQTSDAKREAKELLNTRMKLIGEMNKLLRAYKDNE